MQSSIRRFWQQATTAIHPDDESIFRQHPDHTFNLDYPPPAFIGDVDNAPIVILMAHGGYDPLMTPTEFPETSDSDEYLQWLRGERSAIPRKLSSYYQDNTAFEWIRDGLGVIVNAVAYRCERLTQEPINRLVTELLPSTKAHRQWLHEEVLPEAKRGKRSVVAHHHRLWNLPKTDLGEHVYFSSNPISKNISSELKRKLSSWLSRGSEAN